MIPSLVLKNHSSLGPAFFFFDYYLLDLKENTNTEFTEVILASLIRLCGLRVWGSSQPHSESSSWKCEILNSSQAREKQTEEWIKVRLSRWFLKKLELAVNDQYLFFLNLGCDRGLPEG